MLAGLGTDGDTSEDTASSLPYLPCQSFFLMHTAWNLMVRVKLDQAPRASRLLRHLVIRHPIYQSRIKLLHCHHDRESSGDKIEHLCHHLLMGAEKQTWRLDVHTGLVQM